MKFWGWWRSQTEPEKKPESSASPPKYLEELPPKFEDDVASAAKARQAAQPGVLAVLRQLKMEDFAKMNKMPCFRESMLTGFGIGAVSGAVMYAARRPLTQALNWALVGYLLGSVVTWERCRARIREGKRNIRIAQTMYKQQKAAQTQGAGDAAGKAAK